MFRKALILLSILAIFAISPAHAYYIDYHGTDPDLMVAYHWDSFELSWTPQNGYYEFVWGNQPSVLGPYFSVEADPGDATDIQVTVRVTSWVDNTMEVTSTNFEGIDFDYALTNPPTNITSLVTLDIGEVNYSYDTAPVAHHDIWLNSDPAAIDDTLAATAKIYATSKAYVEFELVSVTPVPEPGVFLLFGTSLMGIALIRGRWKGTNQK